ncbi:hypothetical protein WISP_94942 [Willisornis vidua]|uniref:Uncharacterized protein n=1 Tax=Willisornis vidua TaxID=1566151 RepID=A0ABQ9D0F2_9PASS|nr:hypothetical protein WISP_94942 [Willisornis vidua]
MTQFNHNKIPAAALAKFSLEVNARPGEDAHLSNALGGKTPALEKAVRSSQCGFTKGKFCLTNPTAFYDEPATWMDEGRAVGVVYLGFSKAFHTVSHDILSGNVDWMSGCSSEEHQHVGEMGREELSEIEQRQVQGPEPVEEQPQAPVKAGGDLLESSSEQKELRVLVDNKLSMTSSVTWGPRRPMGSWDALGRALPADQGGGPDHLLSPGEAHLECCVQIWVSQDNRDMELLERVQWRPQR